MSSAPPLDDASLQALQARLAAHGVHSVMAQFTDLFGAPKGKLVPLARLRQWVDEGAGFAGPSIWGTGLPRRGPRSEYHGRVQPHSLRPLPWMPGVAHAVCDGFAGGEPLETCSRQLLKHQLARLQSRGWTLWVGIEPEFFLLRRGDAGWQVADAQDRLAKPSYDLRAIDRQRGFLDELRRALLALDFDIEQIDHEDANGQYEVNYRHDEALAAADRFQLFKLSAQAIAERHGMVYSGMPKPLAHAPGSGLHFHLSLSDAQGRALLAHPGGEPATGSAHMGLSETGLRFAAGLLEHADALAAFCAPTVNSYKRLAVSQSASGTTWSPVWKAIGDNNRTALLRAVAGRLEWRLPDPSCNIYAAIAATLAAGLDGIERALPAPTPCDEDLYERHARMAHSRAAGLGPGAGAPVGDAPAPALSSALSGQPALPGRLPRDLCAALDALEADTRLRGALGEAFCAQTLALRRAQWDQWATAVTDWEWQQQADAP